MAELDYQKIVKEKTDKELLEVSLEPHKYQPIIIELVKKEIKLRRIDLAKLQQEIKAQNNLHMLLDPPPTSDLNNHSRMFIRPFSFEGRIRRIEYAISLIMFMFYTKLLDLVPLEMKIILFFYYIIFLLFTWLIIAQGAKRCHDIGVSGWYQLIPNYLFTMLIYNGNTGHNKYGTNPKNIGNKEDVDNIVEHLKG